MYIAAALKEKRNTRKKSQVKNGKYLLKNLSVLELVHNTL
jgi:hypothetical protein